MKQRILVTGASGFLGGHCILQAPQDFDVFALYHTKRPDTEYRSHWFQGDLLDTNLPSQLLNDIRPEVIIHNAALSKPDDCEREPDLANELNVEATDRLASIAKKIHAKFIFLSTDMVYDGENPPYMENSPTEPVCLYGKTKVLGEQKVLARSEQNLVVRSAVMYGSKGIFGSNFALTMIDLWKQGQPAPVFIDQIRSHVSVKWLVKVLYSFALDSCAGRVNLGGAEPSSRAVFGHCLAEYLGYSDSLLTETSYLGKLQGRRPRDVSFDIQVSKSLLKDNNQPLTLTQGFTQEWPEKTA